MSSYQKLQIRSICPLTPPITRCIRTLSSLQTLRQLSSVKQTIDCQFNSQIFTNPSRSKFSLKLLVPSVATVVSGWRTDTGYIVLFQIELTSWCLSKGCSCFGTYVDATHRSDPRREERVYGLYPTHTFQVHFPETCSNSFFYEN